MLIKKKKQFWLNWRSINSKLKFTKKFPDELEKTIEMLENAIQNELDKLYEAVSIETSSHMLKIRIKDEEQHIDRIVNCMFVYNIKDEAFGYADIELVSNEFSKKPRVHTVWRFYILDREQIIEKVINKMLASLEQIFD